MHTVTCRPWLGRTSGLSLLIWLALSGAVCLAATGCDARPLAPSVSPAASATPCRATVDVVTEPSGVRVILDGAPQGASPLRLTLNPGQYTLQLDLAGYEAIARDVMAQCGDQLMMQETLRDIAPPHMVLGKLPPSVSPEDGLKVIASATDNAGVVRMALWVDGRLVHEVEEPSLRHNLDTRVLAPGTHELAIEAADAAGNVSRETAHFELLAFATTPLPTNTPQPLPTSTYTSVPTPTLAPEATATAVRAQAGPTPLAVSVRWDEITISTYAYEKALYTDPDKAGHPYPLLRRDRVGPPQPRTYQVLILRNEYLELTLLPELGGRLYQCRFLPTGQTLFYNNPVIKPTHWGPPEQGWWLAVGGMEFCLPVEEHGYVSAEPWAAEVSHGPDGSVTVTMGIDEQSRHIETRVGISLRPGESAFHVHPALRNASATSQRVQYWINAMLSPGSHGIQLSLRMYYPTSQVIVHSRGDRSLPDAGATMSWPEHAGRDLSRYAAWRDWLGFFAPDLRQPYTAVYDEKTQLGMVRVFPPEIARGSKLFGFGLGFGDSRAYTDDGSQYIEMWSGLTPTFWDDATLEAGERVEWEESWYVVSRCGGVHAASAEAALGAARDGDDLLVGVAAPKEQLLRLQIAQGADELYSEQFVVRPDAPFGQRVGPLSGNQSSPLIVRILDERGRILLSHEVS